MIIAAAGVQRNPVLAPLTLAPQQSLFSQHWLARSAAVPGAPDFAALLFELETQRRADGAM